MKTVEVQIIQNCPEVIQISFAGSCSNYTPCFSPQEFENIRKHINDLLNHYGEIEYCPNHADLNPTDAGVLVSLSVDDWKSKKDYELQFHDGDVWAQIEFGKKGWELFSRKINRFKLMPIKELKK